MIPQIWVPVFLLLDSFKAENMTNKSGLQHKVIGVGAFMFIISLALFYGGSASGCPAAIAIKCTQNNLTINITNGSSQDYALANKTINDSTIVNVLRATPAIIGAILAIFSKPISEIMVTRTKRGAKVKIKRVR